MNPVQQNHGLTKRESETLALIAEGKSNLEIGDALAISDRTAEKHVENVMRKLGVKNRTAAARHFLVATH